MAAKDCFYYFLRSMTVVRGLGIFLREIFSGWAPFPQWLSKMVILIVLSVHSPAHLLGFVNHKQFIALCD